MQLSLFSFFFPSLFSFAHSRIPAVSFRTAAEVFSLLGRKRPDRDAPSPVWWREPTSVLRHGILHPRIPIHSLLYENAFCCVNTSVQPLRYWRPRSSSESILYTLRKWATDLLRAAERFVPLALLRKQDGEGSQMAATGRRHGAWEIKMHHCKFCEKYWIFSADDIFLLRLAVTYIFKIYTGALLVPYF